MSSLEMAMFTYLLEITNYVDYLVDNEIQYPSVADTYSRISCMESVRNKYPEIPLLMAKRLVDGSFDDAEVRRKSRESGISVRNSISL